jgi:GT2 family glycosyltransferase
MNISGSLVLFCSEQDQFEAAIKGFLTATPDGILYVIDNSPQPLSSDYFSHPRVQYVHNNANLGFGRAHNIALGKACLTSDLHLLLNPDIQFDKNTLSRMSMHFADDPGIAALMPQIRYPDGRLQRLCKLLPTPLDLIIRRFLPNSRLRQKMDARYELHALPQDQPSEVPSLSGCFLLTRSATLLQLGGFDERYFMYMEDVDLVRRLATQGKVVYLPEVSVVHEYAKGSYANKRLLRYHICSAIRYFNKWGWFFDRQRRAANQACLERIRHTLR